MHSVVFKNTKISEAPGSISASRLQFLQRLFLKKLPPNTPKMREQVGKIYFRHMISFCSLNMPIFKK